MATSYRQVFLSLAFAAALTASLAGCGAEKGATAKPARQIDACKLFTAADAQAVLAEEEVVEMTSFLSEAQGKKDPSQCGYNAGSDPSKVVRIEVRQGASADAARGAFDSGRSLLAGSAPQDLPGLGDGAFWVGGTLQQLHVRKGAAQLIITSQPGEGKDPLSVAKAIASKALARL
ncbi:MAG: hypothetical protein QOJ16_1248 [Acidobacteriota bacterium]|nr:hypothetical protein [Acidobacteriota bacterium]